MSILSFSLVLSLLVAPLRPQTKPLPAATPSVSLKEVVPKKGVMERNATAFTIAGFMSVPLLAVTLGMQ
ncbi:hypothetical protein KKF84_03955, partial [Myxococcota bacterium]|nr:hypothetical protein [Myxococcota bacterium]